MSNPWRSKLRPPLPRSVFIPGRLVLDSRVLIAFVSHSCIAYDQIPAGWSQVRASRFRVSRVHRCNAPCISPELLIVWRKPVMLQAMKEEPPLAAKCKDKFLIQSTTITPEKETLSLTDIVSSKYSFVARRVSSVSDVWILTSSAVTFMFT